MITSFFLWIYLFSSFIFDYYLISGTFMKETEKHGVQHFKQRRKFMRYFKIKDSKALKEILKTNPLSFNNVRHPYERISSAFMDRDNPALAHFKRKNFEQFVKNYVIKIANSSLNKKTFFELNHHWRPSNSLCAFCNINYTFISKTETFDEDRAHILRAMGINTTDIPERLNSHGGGTVSNITTRLFSTLSSEVRTALDNLYRYDFEMFNYDKNLY